VNLREAIDLVEMFNSPSVPITHEGQLSHGTFEVNGVPFEFGFTRDSETIGDTWDFLFGIESGFAADHDVGTINNSGLSGRSAVRVIGIVVGLIREFLKARAPDALAFNANKADDRHTLYGAIAHHLKNEISGMGYTVLTKIGGDEARFVIRRVEA
jgi:hypothetical protein